MISINDLWVRYGEGGWVLRGLDMELGRGEAALLTGPNGGGKTTLARILAGLIPAFYPAEIRGSVHVAGVDPLERPDGLAGRVGYVAQDPDTQILTLTVLDEAAYPLLAMGLEPEEARRRAMEILRSLGMEDMAGRSTFMLSSGEAQKTALASSMSYGPSLLVLDEPLTYLDSEASKRFVDALREAKKRDITIVVVEQDVEPLLGIIDKAIILDSGRATEMSGEEFAELYLEGRLSDLVPAPPRGSHECRPPPPRSRPAASVEDAWYRYPRSGEDALRGISLTIHEGAVNALIGPNGSGKTTMLKIIAGVLEPSRGVVRKRFKRAFYVPQNPLLALNGPTVEEEVKAAWREEAPYTPGEALKTMGLQGFEHRRIMHLSHGQRRRLAVASALASGTDMLLLDEPTAGLDAWSRRELPKHLRRIAEAGVTVVVATHDSALVAEAADHAVLLGGGVVREAGSPCTVLGGAGGQ